MKKIYLAAPYSHSDMKVKIDRFNKVTKKAGELMTQGYIVYSPITHSHPIAMQCELPGEWEFWEKIDRVFIEWAHEVWVLQLEGFEESNGINAEIIIARRLGRCVMFINE